MVQTISQAIGRRDVHRLLLGGGIVSTLGGGMPPPDPSAAWDTAMTGIVDVHFHPMVPAVLAEMARGSTPADAPYVAMMQRWTVDEALAQMDAAGIATAMQSIVLPYGLPADPGAARAFVAQANEEAGAIRNAKPGRFGMLAALSMTGTQATLSEIATAFGQLDADGIGLLTHYQGVRLGDPSFDPILAELNERQAVVFVHPALPAIPTPPIHGLSTGHTELPFEATRTIASLLFNGAFARFPHIRFVFTHGGAAVPMLIGRWTEMAKQVPEMARAVPDGVKVTLARQWYDIASVADPIPFAALSLMAPSERILFGSDDPFLPISAGADGLAGLNLAPAARSAIRRGNADRLFPRLRRKRP